MKKHITLSALAIAVLATSNVQGADSIDGMFKEGKTSGEIRMFHIDRRDNTLNDNLIATAIGGHLKFETAELNGLSLGVAGYTTNRIFRGLEEGGATNPNKTLLDANGDSYSILGEAYVKLDLKGMGTKTDITAGRQKLNTPLAGADDARMLPNLFEAYVMHNKDIANTTLVAAHVTKFAAGSFANAYNGGIVGATAGYTAAVGNTALHQGEFTNMGEWALGAGKETSGVTAVAVINKGDNYTVQAWDYYAHNILNAIYLQGDLKWNCLISDAVKPFAAVQYIKQSDVGNKLAGNVDSDFVGAKFGASIGAFKTFVAYSKQSDAKDAVAASALSASTITPWGGMPAFTQGMVTRHMFIAGTEATKVAAVYNFKDLGVNVTATAYYAQFDMASNAGSASLNNLDAQEAGFDLQYYPAAVKNLQLRLRGNFPNNFTNASGGRDWDEYRFIASYKF
jgi:hypothetical protein